MTQQVAAKERLCGICVAVIGALTVIGVAFSVGHTAQRSEPHQPEFWIRELKIAQDPARRRMAVGVLSAMIEEHPEVVQVLCECAVNDPDSRVRRRAIFMLPVAAATRPVIQRALRDPDPIVREAAEAVSSDCAIREVQSR